MNLGNETFRQLLEQIAYYDHEAGTTVLFELTEVIGHARVEGLEPSEIADLVKERVTLLMQDGMLELGDQYYLVLELIEELPNSLADA